MSDHPPFLTDSADTEGAIMAATYRALCAHGYAGLTIQRIAEQFEKSKSLLYHHYDNKDELLVAFLDFMLDQFEAKLPDPAEADPERHLRELVDRMLAETVPPDQREFAAAMVELRAQAAHDERYRTQFSRHDEFFTDRTASIVARGVENGAFRDVDPERVATFLVTVVNGTMTRRVTTEAPALAEVHAAVDDYLDACVLAPEVEA